MFGSLCCSKLTGDGSNEEGSPGSSSNGDRGGSPTRNSGGGSGGSGGGGSTSEQVLHSSTPTASKARFIAVVAGRILYIIYAHIIYIYNNRS